MVPGMNPRIEEIGNLVRKYEGVAVRNYGLAKKDRIDVDVSDSNDKYKEKLKSLIKDAEKYKDADIAVQALDEDQRILARIAVYVSILNGKNPVVEYPGKDLVIGLDCSDDECLEIWPYIFKTLGWPQNEN